MKFLRTTAAAKLRGTALVRLDFNTEDEWRMEATIPTVKLLLKRADKVVVISHRGRPEGWDKKLSLKKDAKALQGFLKRPVIFMPHLDLAKIRAEIAAAPRGSIFLLENLRFDEGEAKNDPAFAKELAFLADYYVNEAFPVSHRVAASVVAITKYLPSYAGLMFEAEIAHLRKAVHPKHPLVVITGGAKAHDKIGVLKFFRKKADRFLIGGASANTLLHLSGTDVGKSKIDEDPADQKRLKEVLAYKNITLPVDWIMSKDRILDIGPKTAALFASHIKRARTIIWSGPLGYIEKKRFSEGSLSVARAIAKNRKAFSVTGGGETVMFLKAHKLDKKFSFISTGGGAMVDFLADEKLPGIDALNGKGHG
jgi:phosphoglycerate kinase